MPESLQDRKHWQRVEFAANSIRGAILGGLIGGSMGLGVCVWMIPETILFPGDTVLAGAIVCGLGGYRYGESFIDWLNENWWWFS